MTGKTTKTAERAQPRTLTADQRRALRARASTDPDVKKAREATLKAHPEYRAKPSRP